MVGWVGESKRQRGWSSHGESLARGDTKSLGIKVKESPNQHDRHYISRVGCSGKACTSRTFLIYVGHHLICACPLKGAQVAPGQLPSLRPCQRCNRPEHLRRNDERSCFLQRRVVCIGTYLAGEGGGRTIITPSQLRRVVQLTVAIAILTTLPVPFYT